MSEETVAQQASTTPRTPSDGPKNKQCWNDPSFKLFGKTIPMNNNNNNSSSCAAAAAAAAVAEDANDDSGSSDLTNGNVDPAPTSEVPPKKPSKVLACPRCDSTDTKFCYYNNYNVNQPRHFCRNCQRYWTAGGLLRNVPVGSGRRKNKHHHHQHPHHRQPQQNSDDHVSASVPAAPAAVAASDAAAPPATTEPSAGGHGDAAKLAAGDDAKFSRVSVPDSGYSGYGSAWMNNSVGAGVSQMWPLFHGGFLANSAQARPDPWSQIQGGPAVFAWPIPWPMPPAWGMNMNTMAARPVTDPCASSVVLGKHGRAEDAQETGKNQETQASCVWMPKTLRIDHPEEAAKSSIWSTLGLVPQPQSVISSSSSSSSSNRSSSTSASSTAGIFRAFRPKSEMGAEAAQVLAQTRSCTATDAQQHQKEHPCAELLRANPAASSRSAAFNEGAE